MRSASARHIFFLFTLTQWLSLLHWSIFSFTSFHSELMDGSDSVLKQPLHGWPLCLKQLYHVSDMF